MVKRKLPITKSAKWNTIKTSEISATKLKNVLEHISTENFMKFNRQDVPAKPLPTATTTDSKSGVKSSKTAKVKGITKKDKMLFKKQRLLQKFDTMSANLRKGLGKKAMNLMKVNRTESSNSNKDITLKTRNAEHKIIINQFERIVKTDEMLKKSKDAKSKTTSGLKDLVVAFKPEKGRSEKAIRKTRIFKKVKNNSNKNRQKNFSRGLNAYMKEVKNKKFLENPLRAITERVAAYVRRET